MKLKRGATNLFLLLGSASVVTVGLTIPQKAKPKLAEPVNFSRDILPILSDKCFKCHGPDSGTRMANMRLDTSEGAFASRGGKFPVVPKRPDHSMVVARINSQGNPMPPKDNGKPLSKAEVALITRWIKEGAPYSKLWSFEPLATTIPIPQVAGDWAKDDLDKFVLARLQKANLSPSQPASRQRWLRRVTYDLTGLPPTEKEISAFETDNAPGAFERVVTRLLVSPHFGERVAVDWLDAARYSDSYGYQSDLLSPTWPYRDWVINAFNRNLPYDQFLTEQIAGDLIPNATRDQRLATAFNRLHRQSNEGGSIAEEFKTTYASDRVETFGTSVLGLTVGCAKCHDHKFDPISQKDYYQLFAYFNNIKEYGLLLSSEIVPTPSLLLPTPEQDEQLSRLRGNDLVAKSALIEAKKSGLTRYDTWLANKPDKAEIPGLIAKFMFEPQGNSFANLVKGEAFASKLGEVKVTVTHYGNLAKLDGDNGIVVRKLPSRERFEPFTWSFKLIDPRTTKAPMVLLHRSGGTDVGFCGYDLILENGYLTARVMRHWPGNAVAIRTKTPIEKGELTTVGWSWDGSGQASGLKLYLNGSPAATSVVVDRLWKKINAYGDLAGSGGDWAFGQRFRELGFKGGSISMPAFADRSLSPVEVAQLNDGQSLDNAFSAPNDELRDYYVESIDPVVTKAKAEVRKTQADLANFENGIYEVSVMEEANPPISAHILARGAYDAPKTDKNRVSAGVPHSLPPMAAGGRNNRLALAKWATQPNHPLTSRVAVNRIWQMLFGTGLVETSENFGVQGSRPTHPKLLDFLARRFVNSGWNMKGLVKSIVLSSTYRQDSVRSTKSAKLDPDNHLLSRGPSVRLPAEMVRDTVLAASGLLNNKQGGPPVNPYQPAGLWQEFNTMSPGFVQSKGADLYRRSLYSTWKRTTPVPSMMTFDATSREACTIRRPSTNTPLQALVLLNDIQFVEAARALAEKLLQQNISDSDRIRSAFRRLAAREPDARELTILTQVLTEQRAEFAKTPEEAKKLARVGESKPDEKLNPVDVSAFAVAVQTIINSDSVIWKR
jgi:Protein of unknown function (DUF1553)/Protein of unknown function (DUF1549)/Planctomycete cytochrome C